MYGNSATDGGNGVAISTVWRSQGVTVASLQLTGTDIFTRADMTIIGAVGKMHRFLLAACRTLKNFPMAVRTYGVNVLILLFYIQFTVEFVLTGYLPRHF